MPTGSSIVDDLIAESINGLTLIESRVLKNLQFSESDIHLAKEVIGAYDNYEVYHLLFALRQSSKKDYEQVLREVRAKILCSALGHLNYLNDWGYLDMNESADGEAALALLETGSVALKWLAPLFDDDRPAPLFGTEEATMSSIFQYRRKDFAYRYMSLILGKTPTFTKEIDSRDKEIERLKEEWQTYEKHHKG